MCIARDNLEAKRKYCFFKQNVQHVLISSLDTLLFVDVYSLRFITQKSENFSRNCYEPLLKFLCTILYPKKTLFLVIRFLYYFYLNHISRSLIYKYLFWSRCNPLIIVIGRQPVFSFLCKWQTCQKFCSYERLTGFMNESHLQNYVFS